MVVLGIGFLAGLLVAAPPVGPITALFYRRLAFNQRAPAIAIGVVASVGDVIHASLVTFGYASLVNQRSVAALVLRVVCVLLLAALGTRYALAPPQIPSARTADRAETLGAVRKEVGRAGLIAVANPSALLSWLVVLHFIRTTVHTKPLDTWQLWALPFSVGLGTLTWFTGVALAWHRYIGQPNQRVARAILRVIGVILLVTSVWYAWDGLRPRP